MARLDARWGNFSERGQAWDHFWQDAPTTSGAATYTFSGDVALTFGVAGGLAVVYAEPAAEALTVTVAAPLAVVFAEPAGVALTFGVAGAIAATAAVVGDVALSFGVSAALVFSPVAEPVLTSAGRAVQWTPKSQIHVHTGRVRTRHGCAARYSVGRVMQSEVPFARPAVRSRRTFVLQPDPLGPVSDGQLAVAATA